jgi:hypothetical protein
MNQLRTLLHDAKGAVLMEFGLLIIPLSIVLLGVLDMGFAMYLRSTMQGAVNDVSRMAVVQNPNFTGTGTIEERISAAIRDRLSGLASEAEWDVDVESFDEFSSVGAPEKILHDENDNGEIDDGDCWLDLQENGAYDEAPSRGGIGSADDIAIYTASLSMPRILPMAELIGMAPNYDIQVRSAVRNQPYANQPVPPTECQE